MLEHEPVALVYGFPYIWGMLVEFEAHSSVAIGVKRPLERVAAIGKYLLGHLSCDDKKLVSAKAVNRGFVVVGSQHTYKFTQEPVTCIVTLCGICFFQIVHVKICHTEVLLFGKLIFVCLQMETV
jgi:hypothetical protein